MTSVVDIFLHLERYLNQILSAYNTLAYVLLYIILFMETGFVVTPFLPGDSLLFATGAIAALDGRLSVPVVIPLLCLAAVAGDTVNYHIGQALSGKVKRREKIPLVKMEHLDKMSRTHRHSKRSANRRPL